MEGEAYAPPEFFVPTNWHDSDEREFALDTLEAEFAESQYVDIAPPSPEAFVEEAGAGIPEIGEPPMPPGARIELFRRCSVAELLTSIDYERYAHWRNIRTPEQKARARQRRYRAEEAAKRWRESQFADSDAMREMIEAFDEIDREKERGTDDG